MTIATILPRKSAAEDRILDLQKSITDYLRQIRNNFDKLGHPRRMLAYDDCAYEDTFTE